MKTIIDFLRLASIIGSLPNNIQNGQTEDATTVMANFNWIVNQVNANAAALSTVALLTSANTFTQVQSGVSATAAANFPIASQVQNSVFLTLTSTLGTNTITARCAALTIGALTNGQIFTFVPSQTNTGPVDLNPDGLGNTRILMMGTNVVAGKIIKDVPLAVRYESPYLHAVNALGTMATQAASAVAITGGTMSGVPLEAANGGSLVLLGTQTASSSASLDFTSLMSATYESYVLELLDLLPATDNVQMFLLTDTNNGASWTTTGYSWAANQNTTVAAAGAAGNTTDAGIRIANVVGNGAGRSVCGTVRMQATAVQFHCVYQTACVDNAGLYTSFQGTGISIEQTVNAVQLKFSSGNIASGKARLYGLKAS